MITKIKMNKVNSYKNETVLETDKKVNLIYGLNGSGKSTLSNYLYDLKNPKYLHCSVEGTTDERILVYNQQFVEDNFYEEETLKGIFSLSKENKDALKKIQSATEKLRFLRDEKGSVEAQNIILQKELKSSLEEATDKTWEIKTTYSGGDRVLEFCLDKLMSSKVRLFEHLVSIVKPEIKPQRTIDDLKKDAEAIKGEEATKYPVLPLIKSYTFDQNSIELLSKVIVGNKDSVVADLIIKLENSDWVKEGVGYISESVDKDEELCPFCQQKTITEDFKSEIEKYFDETYINDLAQIEQILQDYELFLNKVPAAEDFEENPFLLERKAEFKNLYNSMLNALNRNKSKLEEKLKTPANQIALEDVETMVQSFSDFIKDINAQIEIHNAKIDNKEQTLNGLKKEFWQLMRWEYDQTITYYQNTRKALEQKIGEQNKKLSEVLSKKVTQNEIIAREQKNTVNIDDAIMNINNSLFDLGITGFKIVKYDESFYKLARDEQCGDTFKTLSEGEKTMISFLYFCELCKGKESATSLVNRKIVVIDDPISSLSHIYIYNIAQLILNNFCRAGQYEQVIVLTHSLYFFHEIVYLNRPKRDREKVYKLFRMVKNENGTKILNMKESEIQNDYQAYWSIIKDDNQHAALIANSMRNIIEYFFAFIDKKRLNEIFQIKELQNNKYQSFYRYMNKESHSEATNIFDWKEFDYEHFKEAFRLIFVENDYEDHYERMMK